jgi:uncharacterized phage-associated protein
MVKYSIIKDEVIMADVFDVANYILEISQSDSDDEEFILISHMQLQKLVYFCQGYYLALQGSPLFNEAIEAWEHGPVCPKLYQSLKRYGSLPITASIDPEKIKLNEKEKCIISIVYGTYGQYSASRLRKITHEEGPWKTTRARAEIPELAMIQYFESLIEVNPSKIPPSTDEEKGELLKILEQAEANGEIDLSRFCVSMGT